MCRDGDRDGVVGRGGICGRDGIDHWLREVIRGGTTYLGRGADANSRTGGRERRNQGRDVRAERHRDGNCVVRFVDRSRHPGQRKGGESFG